MNVLSGRVYFSLLVLSALVSAYMAFRGVISRDRRGARSFAVLASGLFLWALTEAAELATTSLVVANVARQLRFLAIAVVPVALLLLALQYTGNERYLRPVGLGFLLAVPVFTCLFVLTNPAHHLVWRVEGLASVGEFSVLRVEYGPWYWVHVSYSYLLLALSTLLFVWAAIRVPQTYRRQAMLVVGGIALPWVVNAFYLFGPVPLTFDLTPVSFTFTGAVIGVAVLRYEFLDVVPVARDNIVNVMREGILVVDDRGRIVDVNPAAARVLGRSRDDLVGEPFADAAPDSLVDAAEQGDTRVTLTTNGRVAHFDLRTSSLRSGSVLLLHEVTDQHEQAQRLERQNERLDRFASVLSHDLRNPLNVAQGYVELLQEESDSEFADKVDRSLDRMEHIIEDALTLAREGRHVTDPEPVALDAAARDAWENVVTDDAGLAVETDTVVEGDPNRIKRVFENLFRNAVEHGSTPGSENSEGTDGEGTPPDESTSESSGEGADPTITITVSDLGADGGFYVADDGTGIPESERDLVFDFGYSNHDGSGIGLAIVSEITDAHGWDVTVTESEEGGARFEFRNVTPAT